MAGQKASPATDADVVLYEASDATDEQQIRNEIHLTMDKRFAYWQDIPTKRHAKPDEPLGIWSYGPTPSGCWIDDGFFHVPNVYLGHGCDGLDIVRQRSKRGHRRNSRFL